MKRTNNLKWLVILLVISIVSTFAFGCGTAPTTTENPAVQTPAAQPPATIDKVAEQYIANMGADNYRIPEADLKARVDANDPSMLLLDLRKSEDYAKGHIKGAVNVPFGKVHEYLDKLPADKEIIVYCYSGQTGGQTVAILNMYGYKAKSLNLGFNVGWMGKNNFPADLTPNQLPAQVTPAKPNPAIAQILKDYYVTMPADNRLIASKDLQARIDKGEAIQLIDMRSAADFAKGHIQGAVNIPLKEVNKRLAEFAKDKPVVVYCYTGQTSGQAIALLNVQGIKALSLLSGFDLGWTVDKMPVVQ